MSTIWARLASASAVVLAAVHTAAGPDDRNVELIELPRMWEYSAPLIASEARAANSSRAQKDPSVVYDEGRWHVFMTVKLPGKSAIEHCSFANWEDASASPRTILAVSDSDYDCAPQVFYFRPHRKWHLVERSHGHGFEETGRLVLAKRNPTCPLRSPFK